MTLPWEGEEILVVANGPGECRVRLADGELSERQLRSWAEAWAAQGKPVRVIQPVGAGYQCLAKIAWRLGDSGVRLIHFVDSSGSE